MVSITPLLIINSWYNNNNYFFLPVLDFVVCSCETVAFWREPGTKLLRNQWKRCWVLLPGNFNEELERSRCVLDKDHAAQLTSRGGGEVKEWSILVWIANLTSDSSISFLLAWSEYTLASSNTLTTYPAKTQAWSCCKRNFQTTCSWIPTFDNFESYSVTPISFKMAHV